MDVSDVGCQEGHHHHHHHHPIIVQPPTVAEIAGTTQAQVKPKHPPEGGSLEDEEEASLNY